MDTKRSYVTGIFPDWFRDVRRINSRNGKTSHTVKTVTFYSAWEIDIAGYIMIRKKKKARGKDEKVLPYVLRIRTDLA